MKSIKKLFVGILLMTMISVYVSAIGIEDSADIIKEGVKGGVGELIDLSDDFNNLTSVCFVQKKAAGGKESASLGICDYVKEIEDKINEVDVCETVPNPDPTLFEKKQNSLLANKELSNFCKDKERMLTSALSDIDIFIKNLWNLDQDNATEKEADRKAEDMLKKDESPVRTALYSGNQRVIKDIYLMTEKSNGKSVTDIKLKDLAAPSSYAEYLKEVKLMAEQSMSDHVEQSPYKVSSQIRYETADQNDTSQASDKASELVQKASEHIDRGTSVRTALYIEALSKNDDFAVPTQGMIGVLREELKADAVAKIKNQQKREALIISELKQIDEARKQLVAIGGNKAVVMNRKFDADAVKKEIDDLIEQ